MIAVLLLAGIRKIESGIKYKQERSGNTIEDNAENVFYIKG